VRGVDRERKARIGMHRFIKENLKLEMEHLRLNGIFHSPQEFF
jgi:hypothetical protein